MAKNIDYIYKYYSYIIKKPSWSAFICVLPMVFINLIELSDRCILIATAASLIALLAALNFNEKFGFKKSLNFALNVSNFIMLYFVINCIISTAKSDFVLVNFILQFIPVMIVSVINIAILSLCAFFAYYLINLLSYKLFNLKFLSEKLQIFRTKNFPLYLAIFVLIIFLILNTFNELKSVRIKISLQEMTLPYRYIDRNLKNGKTCFIDHNKLLIYDIKNGDQIDNYLIFREKSDKRYKTKALSLTNGNVLIMQNEGPVQNQKYSETKTYLKLYSKDEKRIVSVLNIPLVYSTNSPMVELNDGRVMIIGGMLDNQDKTLIYNPEKNKVSWGPDLNYKRNTADAILLDSGDVFVFGGMYDTNHPDNTAEIYNIKTNKFEKIPLNFDIHNYVNNTKLAKMPDGRVVILCEKSNYKREDGIGAIHGGIFPTPYLVIFDPLNKTFEEIKYNHKNKKGYKRTNFDFIVLNDDRIMIAGGNYVQPVKGNYRGAANDILIYNPKDKSFKRTNKNLKKPRHGIYIMYKLPDNTIIIKGGEKVEKISLLANAVSQ